MVMKLSSGPWWGAWDFGNPKNWVINKSLNQNLQEFSVGSQIIGLTIPSAMAYKAASTLTTNAASLATRAATQATTTAAAASGSAAGGITASIAGSGAMAALGLAQTGIKAGTTVYALEWLQKNWWIPALLIGGYFGIKLIGGKK